MELDSARDSNDPTAFHSGVEVVPSIAMTSSLPSTTGRIGAERSPPREV